MKIFKAKEFEWSGEYSKAAAIFKEILDIDPNFELNYINLANSSLAKYLKGKLLLMHGDMDDNVHPALTIQLVDALIKANKDFDLLILPNLNHLTPMYTPYFIRRQWDYFVIHLLGKTPPKEYQIQDPDPKYIKKG